jgi:hypothetical protein
MVGQVVAFSSVLCFTMSLMKIYPRVSLNVGFKKFTVFQMLSSFAIIGWYLYEVNAVKNQIPIEELYLREQ